MNRFCANCGSPTDAHTGLCPVCDAYQIQQLQEMEQYQETQFLQKNQQYPQYKYQENRQYQYQEIEQQNTVQNQKKKRTTAIICTVVGIVVLTLIILGICFGDSGNKADNNNNNNNNNTVETIHATYVSYLKDKIVPTIGVFDVDNPATSADGVHSAKFYNLDDSDDDEFLVAYSQKNGSDINFNISCYGLAGNINDNSSSDNNSTNGDIKLIGSVNPFSTTDYLTEGEAYRIPNSNLLYLVENNGKKYIVSEQISWFNTYSYQCHIYSVENGGIEEVSNLYVPDIGTNGIRLVYSTKLPTHLIIDNSDFDYSQAEYIDISSGDGNYILYYNEGPGDDKVYEYTKYYNSEDSTVSSFLSLFGIDKSTTVTQSDNGPELVFSDNAIRIYSYTYYFDYDDNGNRADKYEINDYTDLKSLIEDSIEETVNTEASKPDEVVNNVNDKSITPTEEDYDMFEDMINKSGWVWGSGHIDENTKTEDLMYYVLNEGVPNGLYTYFYGDIGENDVINGDPQNKFYGDYEVRSYKLGAEKVDWILSHTFGRETDHSIETDMFYYDDDYLYYLSASGGGCGWIYEIADTKKFDKSTVEFIIRSYADYDDPNFERTYSYYRFVAQLKADADNSDKHYWQIKEFTGQIDPPEEVTTTTATTQAPTTTASIKAAYQKVINKYEKACNKDHENTFCTCSWAIFDMDGDGTDELIIEDGVSEQGKTHHVYTFNSKKAVNVGEYNAWHLGLYIDNNTLVGVEVNPAGDDTIYNIKIENNKVVKELNGNSSYDPSDSNELVFSEIVEDFD